MPFKSLRYIIQISRYEDKSEMDSLYGNFEFPAKQDICLKIKELCYLANTKPEHMLFNFLDIQSSSRDMRENRKWSICTAAILNFPAK